MSANAILQVVLYLVLLTLIAVPLGRWMTRVFDGRVSTEGWMRRVFGPLERGVYRALGVRPGDEMTWKRYAFCVLLFSLAGTIALYLLQRLQGDLPLNPAGLAATTPEVAFNTATSFVTNTNWQSYGGEWTMSYLTQAVGLTTQNPPGQQYYSDWAFGNGNIYVSGTNLGSLGDSNSVYVIPFASPTTSSRVFGLPPMTTAQSRTVGAALNGDLFAASQLDGGGIQLDRLPFGTTTFSTPRLISFAGNSPCVSTLPNSQGAAMIYTVSDQVWMTIQTY